MNFFLSKTENMRIRRVQILQQKSTKATPVIQAPSDDSEIPKLDFDWASILARQIGTVTHAIFQNLNVTADTHVNGNLTEKSLLYAEGRFRSLGLSGSRLARAMARVEGAIKNVLASDRGKWLYEHEHSQVESEFQLISTEGGISRRIVIDKTFIDKSNRRWVIDYKTGYHDGSDVERFLDSEVSRHRPQLEYYAKVLSQTEDREIIIGLYFPMLDRWREWPYLQIKT